jgi:hypothetical protein
VALKRGFAPVAFDELAWQDDLRNAGKSARRIGEETALAWSARVRPWMLYLRVMRMRGTAPVSPAA